MTQNTYNKNPHTKTSYILESTEVKEITETEHKNITCDETCKWFRRLGGSETVQRNYTNAGYKVTKLTSTSPDKQIKKVREFSFKWVEKVN
jgi:predicted esterase YcpF (UPF0227 family)